MYLFIFIVVYIIVEEKETNNKHNFFVLPHIYIFFYLFDYDKYYNLLKICESLKI